MTLTGARPKVWRRFEVDGKITLAQLHEVIQVIMGWQNQHPYAFYINGVPFEHTANTEATNPATTLLGSTVRKLKDEVAYVYDPQGFWDHRLFVEYIGASYQYRSMPKLLAGSGHSPPESSGGVYSFNKAQAQAGKVYHPLYSPKIDLTAKQQNMLVAPLGIPQLNAQIEHMKPKELLPG